MKLFIELETETETRVFPVEGYTALEDHEVEGTKTRLIPLGMNLCDRKRHLWMLEKPERIAAMVKYNGRLENLELYTCVGCSNTFSREVEDDRR